MAATALLCASCALAAEESIASPSGRIVCTVGDGGGLHYRVLMDGTPALANSRLGLDFEGGLSLGPAARIEKTARKKLDSTWENFFGKRRVVRDHYREMSLDLRESGGSPKRLRLIVRAYDNGVAFRYDLPPQPGLESFVITNERTEFVFAGDYRAWVGEYSSCTESRYLEKRLTQISADTAEPSVLPLLVELPRGYAAITESDLIDWAGMFLSAASPDGQGQRRPAVKATLAPRKDKHGLVVSDSRRLSPWRVIMLARSAAELLGTDLVATLATPSKLADISWIQPGISAWDAWWTGVNPSQPKFQGVAARGDTRSHEEYIEFASEMGWRYQLIDWHWYEPMNTPAADLTKPTADVDIPALVAYARARGVRLFLWVHSDDLGRQGVAKVLAHIADWGFAGVKIDFMNSDSQETVRWYVDVLEEAARRHLLVDFHGAYKPTGLARTWPNFITQEGVLGNEYNKLPGNKCTPQHQITLPFTRGLLGPMDFTPGGFVNRTIADFRITSPAQVMGTRARQLAMTVVYESPLLVLCDSPANYRGKPGIEFFRGLPTVWDDSVVPSAEVAKHVVIARRSGDSWWLAAMNAQEPLTLNVPLNFLGTGAWRLREFADGPEAAEKPESIAASVRTVKSGETIQIKLAPNGGYAGALTR